jgi:hypothetical protein
VWRWDHAEPFGNNPADEDPDANSVAFDLPLRLPGQRYDAETALHFEAIGMTASGKVQKGRLRGFAIREFLIGV